MKTKYLFFLLLILGSAFILSCNKDVLLDPPVPSPDYRDNYEGTYLCRQVDVLKQELTEITLDTTYDDTLMVEVIVDHDLPGNIHVNEREIAIDSTGIFMEYEYYLKFSNDSIYINKQQGSGGSYTDIFIFGKKQ